MTFEESMKELGQLLKQTRKTKNLTLYQLAHKSGIVADHIQKIENAKHGGVEILTYAQLLFSLKVSLSFSNDDGTSIALSKKQKEFINWLFFNLPKDNDLQFLNYKPTIFLDCLGKEIYKKRKKVSLTQKELSQKTGLSNTTISHIESGKYNFNLHSLYKIAKGIS